MKSTGRGCTKSFHKQDAAVLAPSSGEEPASPRHRAGGASMAWKWPAHSGNSWPQKLRELLDLAVDAAPLHDLAPRRVSFSHSPSVKLAHRDSTPDVRRIHPRVRHLDRVVQFRRREAALPIRRGCAAAATGVGIWQPLRSIQMKSPVTKSWMRSILNLSPRRRRHEALRLVHGLLSGLVSGCPAAALGAVTQSLWRCKQVSRL